MLFVEGRKFRVRLEALFETNLVWRKSHPLVLQKEVQVTRQSIASFGLGHDRMCADTQLSANISYLRSRGEKVWKEPRHLRPHHLHGVPRGSTLTVADQSRLTSERTLYFVLRSLSGFFGQVILQEKLIPWP